MKSIQGNYKNLKFDNIEALSDVSGSRYGQSAVVLGYYEIDDNGGGLFFWDGSDLSTKVASESKYGLYVPPATDPSGKNGAWVRRLSFFVTPEMWGIDGIDDNIEIQEALNSLISVQLLGKIYNVSNDIELPTATKGRLTGNVNTRLKSSATSGTILTTPSGTNIIGWEIDHIFFDGNEGQVTGIYWEGWKKSVIKNCFFFQCSVGIDMYNDAYYNELLYNKYRECDIGVRADGADNFDGLWPNTGTIRGGSFELCDTGVQFNRVQNFRITDSAIEQCVNFGVVLGNFATAIKVTNNRFENATGYHYDFIGGTSDNRFTGNQYSGGASRYQGTPSKRDHFDDGYTWGGNSKAIIIGPNGLIKFGAQNYQEDSGLGLTPEQAIEFLSDSGAGSGYRIKMDQASGSLELHSRENTGTWTRFMKVRKDNLNRTRIGDTGDPTAATLSSTTFSLDELSVEPAKQKGVFAMADGIGWDPGSGPGVYVYSGTAWIPSALF